MLKSKKIKITLGDTFIQRKCAHCKNPVTFKAHRIERKIVLFEKPLYTIHAVSYISCPICDLKREISGTKLKKYLSGKTHILML